MEDDFLLSFDDLNLAEEAAEEVIAGVQTSTGGEEDQPEEGAQSGELSINISETNPPVGTEGAEEEEEEEDKDKQGTDSSEKSPSSEADSSQQSTLYALAKYLKDEGVLLLDEEIAKVDSIDELKSLIKTSHDKARYVNMSDTQKRYLDALENGVPVKEYETLEKEISTFQDIKVDSIDKDPQLQYEILAIDYMNQGLSQEKAMKLAQLSVKSEGNESVADAKEALQNIIKFKSEKFKELISTKQEQTEIDLKTIKENIDAKNEILTMPVNDITKNRLFDLMTTKVASDDNGLPLNKLQKFQKDNPIEAKILMNYLFMMTNEGKDLGLIKTNTTSKASKDLEKKLKQLNFDASGSLIIPEGMVSNKGNSNNNNKNNLTINI